MVELQVDTGNMSVRKYKAENMGQEKCKANKRSVSKYN